MCDTLVAVANCTADGSAILAKNSDREPNEAQVLTYVPRTRHEPGAKVRCTYVEVPQAPETYEVLLCRPFWMWGAEMGANEHGVAIGNEAIFTREPYGREPGLIGMDMLRLALERADTARRALEIIVGLLETYGQSGNCGFHHRLYYHNSFLIADPSGAWVLETAGQHWAAERVRDVRTISNGPTICEPDEEDPAGGLARRRKGGGTFAQRYTDPFMARIDGCRTRQRRATALLRAAQGRITPAVMMAALRDHGERAAGDPSWNPSRGWLMETICMHAGLGPTRPSQSVGSMVAHLTAEGPVVWVTGTSAPCTGLFKPVYLGGSRESGVEREGQAGAGLPNLGPEPGGTWDAGSLFWAHERLHRAVIRDYPARLAAYREERDALESAFLAEAAALAPAGRGSPTEPGRWAAFSARCFERAAQATREWTARVSAMPVQQRPPRLFALAWDRFNREAAMEGKR